MGLLALATLPAFASIAGTASATTLACASIPLFICAFAAGAGPVPYLLYSEVYASRVRAKGASLSGGINWAANIALTWSFLPLMHGLGDSLTYALYGIINAWATAFTCLHVFETKGRSLQEIERAAATPGACPLAQS